MKISTSNNYHHGDCQWLSDCERHYCNFHRLLWSDCDTAKESVEGDSDVINGTHTIIENGDCPKCESDARMRRYAMLIENHQVGIDIDKQIDADMEFQEHGI